MIIAKNSDATEKEFVSLLSDSHDLINVSSRQDPARYKSLTPTQFEEEVFDKLCWASASTNFKNRIELITGHRRGTYR